ncbi:MAG TPA: hypothetical protein IAC04_04680 [Candidatus Coprenecus stercoravium]|uniref:Uncharacterized protein n=1 Tax=Candidatus Coprenecus stercoravium TaxID=2840735 RepID=A0A9D2GPF7_9BACT|nr:hypothetical protein [Candidatus Coprenecus stercoravium]
MMTEKYIHEILAEKSGYLLNVQHSIATAYYGQRTGQLVSALSRTAMISDRQMHIQYPMHIRFLDLKRTPGGKKKKVYEPIYNKYVYGYIYIGVYRALMAGITGEIRRQISQVFPYDTEYLK